MGPMAITSSWSKASRRVLARYLCALLVLAALTAGSFLTVRGLIAGMAQREVLISEAADLRSAIHKTMLALDGVSQGDPEAPARAAAEAEVLSAELDRLIETMADVSTDEHDWALVHDPATGLRANILMLLRHARTKPQAEAPGHGHISDMPESTVPGDMIMEPPALAAAEDDFAEPQQMEPPTSHAAPLPAEQASGHAGHSPAMASIDALIEHLRSDRDAEQERASRLHDLLGAATIIILLAEAFVVFRPLVSRADTEAARADMAQSELEYLASHDALTGLLNRGQIDRVLDVAVHEASSESKQLGLVLLDLDEFKPINDRLGHAAGDAVLVAVADRIRRLLGSSGVAGRLGGDEFIVLVSGPRVEGHVALLAKRLLEELRAPVEYGSHLLHPRASIGYAVFPAAGSDVATLLAAADLAMYAAKRSGRGRVSVFSEQMRAEADRLRCVEREIREAFEREQFEVLYDVIQDTSLGLIGVEALVRWQHPVRGTLASDQFLTDITAAGQTAALTDFAIFTALAQAAKWRELGLFNGAVHVNVDESFLRRGDACSVVRQALVSCHLDPSDLVMRVSREVRVDDPGVCRVIDDLHGMGVTVGISGLGVGSVPLSALERLSIGLVTLSPKMASKARTSDEGRTVLTAMLKICRAMDKTLVMEGIDDAALAELARSEGASACQGRYFGEPRSAAEMAKHLREAIRTCDPRATLVFAAADTLERTPLQGQSAA